MTHARSDAVDVVNRALLRRSVVPVLLPAAIPSAIGPAVSVAVISAGPQGYYVGFSAIPDCAGARSCTALYVAGAPSAEPLELAGGTVRRVRLPGATSARFKPEDCSGSSCSEAVLTFDRAGSHYEIDVRSGSDDERILRSVYRALRRLDSKPSRSTNGR
jgi:hypothetical protein